MIIKDTKKIFMKKLTDIRLDVLGFPYKVKFVEKLYEKFHVSGLASSYGSIMEIEPDMTPLDIISTVLHETLELMFRKTETKYEHEIISRFETFLMALLIENPKLMEIIMEVIKVEGKPIKHRTKQRAKALLKKYKGV